MTIIDAIVKANELVRKETGVSCDPSMVRLIPEKPSRWFILYDASHFFSEALTQGSVVDGGEVVVNVDCKTGDAALGSQ